MALRIPNAVRDLACDAVTNAADAGAGAATVEIRTGSQPATANDTATGTLLATITCADPAFTSGGTGVNTLAGTPRTATAGATGTAGWFRMKDSNGNTVMDGSVTATGGGGEIELNATAITSGGDVSITSGTVTMPGG
jgi:hypothetical protein